MPLDILIVGGGVCGPAAALMLQRSDASHRITVAERSPSPREGGQQIDIRAQGIPIMRELGLLDEVRRRSVREAGVAFVSQSPPHRRRAVFRANETGKGAQALTSEFEIMRGDLVRLLAEASLREGRKAESQAAAAGGGGWTRHRYGCGIKGLEQLEQGGSEAGGKKKGRVAVTFDDGTCEQFDLVIGADGQGSKTRRLLFGQEASDAAFRSLGCFFAFFSIPRTSEDEEGDGDGSEKPGQGQGRGGAADIARLHHAPGRRSIFLRTGDRPVTQAYLGICRGPGEDPELAAAIRGGDAAAQRAALRERFHDAGWQADRVLRGMDASDDFYATELAQVKLPSRVRGRVALVGDAGYVPSAATGMGTTAALVGAWVLAGELAKHHHHDANKDGHDDGDDDDDGVEAALAAYDETMAPFIAEAQKLIPGAPGLLHPETRLGISIMHGVIGAAAALRIDQIANRLMPENKGGWSPPEYAELKKVAAA